MRRGKFTWLSPGEILLIATLIILPILYSFMFVRFLSDTSMFGTDFISFYTAGRIARQGDLHHLFDIDTQRSIQEPIVGVGSFSGGLLITLHPPYLVPLLASLAVDNFILSFKLWTFAQLVCVVICGVLIYKFIREEGFHRQPAIWISLSGITFFPLFLSILSGQDTVWTLLGLLIWMSAMIRQRERQAGFGLAFATLNPTIAGALALPLMVTRRKAALWFLIGMAGLGLYSLLMIGLDGARDYIKLLTISAGGSEYGLNPSAMYNLLGLLLRTFPSLSLVIARQISWAILFLVLISIVILWWKKGFSLTLEHIGLAVVLVMFTSPHLHVHSLSYLILPALVIAMQLMRHHRQGLALALLPVTSWMILITIIYSNTWSHLIVNVWMLGSTIFFVYNIRHCKTLTN